MNNSVLFMCPFGVVPDVIVQEHYHRHSDNDKVPEKAPAVGNISEEEKSEGSCKNKL